MKKKLIIKYVDGELMVFNVKTVTVYKEDVCQIKTINNIKYYVLKEKTKYDFTYPRTPRRNTYSEYPTWTIYWSSYPVVSFIPHNIVEPSFMFAEKTPESLIIINGNAVFRYQFKDTKKSIKLYKKELNEALKRIKIKYIATHE